MNTKNPSNFLGQNANNHLHRQALHEQVENQRIGITDDMPPEQRRARYLRHCEPAEVHVMARRALLYQQIDTARDGGHFESNSLLPSITRDDSRGLYISTYEQWQAPFHTHRNGDRALDGEIIQALCEGQPHRLALALLPPHQVPPSTYAPVMLPHAHDPLSPQNLKPAAEPPPPVWSPQATPGEITAGIARDILDCAATYAARLKVATGHQPDADAIDQLNKLTKILKTAKQITTPTPRRTSPGRPKKRGIRQSVKVITLQLEYAEKRKKHGIRKNCILTQTKSASELEINTQNENTT